MAVKTDKYLTPHFRVSEMRCRCRRPGCDAPAVDMDFMRLLEDLRVQWESPLVVDSGVRCVFWNDKKGGAPDSQHLHGKAVDLWLESSGDIYQLALMAEKLGFGGIGTGRFHLLHLDTGPSGRRWTYHDK